MKLILFRHGLALDRQDSMAMKMEDSLRPLIARGRERTLKMAKAIKKMELSIDMIVSSPFVRAKETAEILFEVCKSEAIHECTELVPSAPPMAFAQWLKNSAKRATCVLAVGHEPQLSIFASWAIAGTTTSIIDLKKSGMICLEIESFDDLSARSAILKWVLQPKNIFLG